MLTPEGKVKAKGRILVRAAGFYQFPVNQGGFGRAGIPDDMCCAFGLFIAIEYKALMRWDGSPSVRKKSLPTIRQCAELAAIHHAGGHPLVVDATGLEELKKLITQLKTVDSHTERVRLLEDTPLRWRWEPQEYAAFLEGGDAAAGERMLFSA